MNAAPEGFELVRLRSGAVGIRSLAYHEVCHPGVGPRSEAEALYVQGLDLPRRFAAHLRDRPFIIWDVGLGGAANATAVIDAAGPCLPGLQLEVVSFDRSLDGLRFALGHASDLGYFGALTDAAGRLLETGRADFVHGGTNVRWTFVPGDFTRVLRGTPAGMWSAPDAILFDPHSPGANPDMWTVPLFRDLFARLDPRRPCALSTYSRSTAIRAAMLLAGFHVGAGSATGLKEETTLAANCAELAGTLLGSRWLQRAHRSAAAEPWTMPPYEHRPLTAVTARELARHIQFAHLQEAPSNGGASFGGTTASESPSPLQSPSSTFPSRVPPP